MTPEKIDALENLIKLVKGMAFTDDEGAELLEALAIAKSAIPSGQVAEDLARLHKRLETNDDKAHAAAERLAAQAQSAEAWRKRAEAAADALADVLPGEAGRLDLLARINELKRLRDGYGRDLKEYIRTGMEVAEILDGGRGFLGEGIVAGAKRVVAERDAALARVAELERQVLEEGGKFLREMGRADRLQDKVNALSAAGQVLSEHVDKAQGAEPPAEDLCTAEDAKTALRDEFAKAAMQVVMDWNNRSGATWTNDEAARRSYLMADAMLKAREAL